MEDVLSVAIESGRAEQNRRISEVIQRERRRLLHFIRKRVDDEGDAEDILHDVFYELIEAYRLMKPVEQVGAWLYRVARNRIIDRFRRRGPEGRAEIPLRASEEGAQFRQGMFSRCGRSDAAAAEGSHDPRHV